MTNTFETRSSIVSVQSLIWFMEALLLRKAALALLHTGKHSESFHSRESCMDFFAVSFDADIAT